MLVQPISRLNIFNSNKTTDIQKKDKAVSFGSSTSAGQPIRKLRNVPCAFFDVITISSPELTKIENDLKSCTTVKKAVRYLQKYKENNMLKVEKQMFDYFQDAAPFSSRMQFPALLQSWYKNALIQLKLEEFAVIDEIDKISLQLSPETTFAVRRKTTNCRKVIIDDNPQNRFKRKTVLDALEKITPKRGEERIMAKLMDRATYLPTSATSINAFIVKYADRSHEEISNRLIKPTLLTIDHVLANSKGGPNDMSNFLGTSAGANNLKQDMWFKLFVKRFPEVIENSQRYIEFFIDIINNGGFKGNQAYPYKINKRLIQESDGKVKLDLSMLKYSKEEALELEENHKKSNKKR